MTLIAAGIQNAVRDIDDAAVAKTVAGDTKKHGAKRHALDTIQTTKTFFLDAFPEGNDIWTGQFDCTDHVCSLFNLIKVKDKHPKIEVYYLQNHRPRLSVSTAGDKA